MEKLKINSCVKKNPFYKIIKIWKGKEFEIWLGLERSFREKESLEKRVIYSISSLRRSMT